MGFSVGALRLRTEEGDPSWAKAEEDSGICWRSAMLLMGIPDPSDRPVPLYLPCLPTISFGRLS